MLYVWQAYLSYLDAWRTSLRRPVIQTPWVDLNHIFVQVEEEPEHKLFPMSFINNLDIKKDILVIPKELDMNSLPKKVKRLIQEWDSNERVIRVNYTYTPAVVQSYEYSQGKSK